MTDTEADEQQVAAYVQRIEEHLIAVLERHCIPESPRFSRWASMHSVVDLAGRLMLSTIQIEGEDARPGIVAMIERLDLLLRPPSRSAH